MKQKLILVDGILASGKSFTITQLEENPNVHKVVEPVELYRNCQISDKIYNALGLYYENPKENAVCLQLHIIECLERLTRKYPEKAVVSERYLTSVHPFTQTMLDCNYISEFSTAFILQKLDEAMTRINEYLQIEKIIFLDTDIELCLERWLLRERREEMKFAPDEMKKYLTFLRSNYLNFYEKQYSSELVIVKNNDLSSIRKIVSDSLGESLLGP